jgi:hypothetical protein
MSDEQPIGDGLTITFQSLDGKRELTLSGDVVTIDDVLKLVEDAMRGAGFNVPHESLNVLREDVTHE